MNDNSEGAGFAPEVVVLYCGNCVSPDANITAESSRTKGFTVRTKMLPCSSKVEVSYLLKILEQGADGVEIVACPEEKCQFLIGSLRAEKRIKYAGDLLDEIDMGAERLGISRGECLSAQEIMGLAANRARAVRSLGPNPMKKGESR